MAGEQPASVAKVIVCRCGSAKDMWKSRVTFVLSPVHKTFTPFGMKVIFLFCDWTLKIKIQMVLFPGLGFSYISWAGLGCFSSKVLKNLS